MKKTSHLRWKGNRLFFQLGIPAEVRQYYGGKSVIEKSTGTDSRAVAVTVRDSLLGHYRAEFKRLKEAGERTLSDAEIAKLIASETVAAFSRLKSEAGRSNEQLRLAHIERDLHGEIATDDRVRDLLKAMRLPPHGENLKVADRVIEAAESRALSLFERGITPDKPQQQGVPLSDLIDTFLDETDLEFRQRRAYRREIERLIAWLEAKGHRSDASTNRKIAGDFVSYLLGISLGQKTITNYISVLSSFWRWLIAKGHAETNIWTGHFVGKRKDLKAAKRRTEKRRAYTDDEVKTLLAGKPSPILADFIRLSLLHGFRVSEIAWLRARNCTGGNIEIASAKTPAGNRTVPCHSEAQAIIKRLVKGKKPDDFLFPSLPIVDEDHADAKSAPISKAFTRYRRKCKVDDRKPGQRNSMVDFHSLRRWTIRKMKEALENGATGFTPWTIAECVGHEGDLPLSLTMKGYAGASSAESMRACIEAVSLKEPPYPGPLT